MSRARSQISFTATTLICGLLALLSAPARVHAADEPAAAINSDAHHLAVDVQREAHVVGHRVEGEAHDFNHQLLAARTQMSNQLHQLSHRLNRWWHRVRAG